MAAPVSRCEIASLEFTSSVNNSARVALIYDRNVDPLQPIALFNGVMHGQAVSGGAARVEAYRATIRLVRRQGLTWGFFGTREGEFLDEWTSLTSLGVLRYGDASGVLSLAVRNLSSGATVRARISNYTSRGHLTIGDHLAVNKTVLFPDRIMFNVPRAALSEFGPAEVVAFGEGLSEADLLTGDFTYTLPESYSVSPGFRIFNDAVLKDG